MKVNHTKNLEDKLQIEKEDRRLLPNVPDPSGRRTNVDRRQGMDGEIRDSDSEHTQPVPKQEGVSKFISLSQ